MNDTFFNLINKNIAVGKCYNVVKVSVIHVKVLLSKRPAALSANSVVGFYFIISLLLYWKKGTLSVHVSAASQKERSCITTYVRTTIIKSNNNFRRD